MTELYSRTEEAIVGLLQTFGPLPERLIYDFLPVLDCHPPDQELRRRVIEFRLAKLRQERSIYEEEGVYAVTPDTGLRPPVIDSLWVMRASLGAASQGAAGHATLIRDGRLGPARLMFTKRRGEGPRALYYVAHIEDPADVGEVLLLEEKLFEMGNRRGDNTKIIVVTPSLTAARSVPKPAFDTLVAHVTGRRAVSTEEPVIDYYNCVQGPGGRL